jgi:histidinol phosphatase-like PHP family hydrolase
LDFLKLACAADIQITFGADAHAPHEVGMNLQDAVELATEAGYDKCCRFAGRKKSVVII